MTRTYKFLILTDSISNPRVFPASEATSLEETYPYLIRREYSGSTFWQLSYGDMTTEQLISQAAVYLSNWNPDYIIIQAGINDARPEAFTEFQKIVLRHFFGRFFPAVKQYVYHPFLIKHRQVYRVKKEQFSKTARKLRLLFQEARIFWFEIACNDGYEHTRPGVRKRLEEYNAVIQDIYGDGFVRIKPRLLKANGFNEDHLHWNKAGHQAAAEALLAKIRTSPT